MSRPNWVEASGLSWPMVRRMMMLPTEKAAAWKKFSPSMARPKVAGERAIRIRDEVKMAPTTPTIR